MTWKQYQSAIQAKQAKVKRAYKIKVLTISIMTTAIIVLVGAGFIKGCANGGLI